MVRDLKVKRAVFLDRDGTINREVNYLSDPNKFELLPGAAEAIAKWNAKGWKVVVVTNQSGVARGYLSTEMLERIHTRMHEALASRNARVDAIYFCTHLPEDACACRKPGIELFRRAADDLDIDMQKSFFIGDKWTDVLPALEVGGQGILLRTGHGESQIADGSADDNVMVANELHDAFCITMGLRRP